ncbi:MAG TPA: cytidylate kinase-like family protein [Candidatus Acidoferrum sp.]|jgi:cytidylate kinase|nr:cytidylate kinase-like family protein [Candidatus Acidoferrum sp.]
MNLPLGLDHCFSIISAQLQPPHTGAAYRNGTRRRAITISRQSGSGGHAVAARLAELLQTKTPPDERPWTVFDRNLVERVLEDHHLSSRLARFMPEDRIGEVSDTIDELFGLHPPSWTLVRKSADTILHLAELGNVILIGRAANVITRKLDDVFHVRLVGSLEKRVKYMQEFEHLDYKSALELVDREDLGRRRYLKKYFDKEIDDPLLYHMVINTDLVPYEEAAHLIADAVTAKVEAEAVP